MIRLHTLYALAGALSFVLCLSPAYAQYTIIDLGAINPNGQSRGYGINNLGEVAGWSDGRAFFWTQGVMMDLGVLSGTASEARDVNDLGQVVGWSDAPQARHAFIWQDRNGNRRSDAGEMIDLRPVPSTWQSRAYGINNAGHVAGWSTADPDGVYHAFRWSPNPGGGWDWFDLGTTSGNPADISLANDINGLGQVVGGSGSAGSRRAFRTQPYALINPLTDTLPYLPGGTNAEAFGINDRGQVVGFSNTRIGSSTVTRPVLWDGNRAIDLGTLGGNIGRAFGVNIFGHVVGHSYLADNTSMRAFLWANGVLRNLNDLLPPDSGWVLNEARAINDFGQITGYGARGGITRAFLLTPVPTMVVIHLDGYAGDYTKLTLQVEVRSSTGESLLTFRPRLRADGTFDLILTPDSYTLAFKADRSLRRVFTGITLPAGTLAVNLVNGDANNDNEVSLIDFAVLLSSFGKSEGEVGFEPTADFDGDGEVNLSDFGILVRQLGQVGEE
ncbi:MAG: dockerin type I domain-containing protein [Armatimonadota bacterium]|nr:dockerin type I domain-containing protein [Armatimonadota bacterium]